VVILTVIKGPDRGKRFELPEDAALLVGRSSTDIPLDDQTISRRHAQLVPEDDQWMIHDLKSANGTFVNGVRVADPRPLKPGDQIRVGSTLFLFGLKAEPKKEKSVRVAKSGELDINVEAMVKASDDSMIMAVPEPSEAAVRQLTVLYELVQLMGSTFERDQLLEKVMDVVFEHFKPDRGFVLLADSPGDAPEAVIVRYRDGDGHITDHAPDDERIMISRTIVQHVIKNAVGILSSNAMNDGRFAGGESIINYGIRSTLCVPIKFKAKIYGVIHLDSQVANFTFTEDQLRLLAAIGGQTAMALDNLRLLAEQISRERLTAMGETVASLSHSIKNIIQGVRGGSDVVELGLKKDNLKVVRGGWDIVARNLEQIYSLTTNMLAFSKTHRPELEMTDLSQLLGDIVELVQGQFDRKGVLLLTDFDRIAPSIPLDPGGIHQAVLNLVNNALDAVPEQSGRVSLTTRYLPETDQIQIQVDDNGPGIDPALRKHLFKPFHSTKGMRGTGLGLTVTRKLVEEHGGRAEYVSSKEEGTTFTLTLPTQVSNSRPELSDDGTATAPPEVDPLPKGLM